MDQPGVPMLKTSLLSVCLAACAAWSLPAGFKKTVLVTGGLNPVSLCAIPDGRMLVVEKHGVIRILDRDGKMLAAPFLDWSKYTIDAAEKGMMAVMLHPDFAGNGIVFVQYSNNREFSGKGRDQISTFKAVGNAVDPASETLFFSLGSSGDNYHHGGGMAIGPDGKMYVACGNRNNQTTSGGSADKNAILGKMLRMNVDGTIPSDNPFYAANTGDAKAVWSYGHRNPFSFDFLGSRLFLNDVMDGNGDDELNEVVKGEGYGYGGGGSKAALYHASGVPNYGSKAMVGAMFYKGTQFPEKWRGAFFFGGEEESDRRMHVFHPDATGDARFEDFDQGVLATANDGSECAIGYAQDIVGSVYIATRCLTRRWTGGKVIKYTYGDPPPWPSTSAMADDAARKSLRWKALPGAVSIELLRDMTGTLELRDLQGKAIGALESPRAGRELRIPTGGAKGLHFLVLKTGAAAAAIKLML
jgi:glucose/arabinose dehydrogenase